MAFYYFTTETIKEIDPQAVPDSFREYYADLSDEMKLEIRDIHPDLFDAMTDTTADKSLDFDLFDDSELSVEEQRIINEWESINIKEWHKDVIETDVLVCKVIPDGIRRCKIHRTELIKKQMKYKNGYAVYGHYGYLCPECMTLYIEESKIGDIIEGLDKRNHKMWIQPLEDTIQEWDEYVEPKEIEEETIIYIPDNWADIDMKCPADGGELIPDTYKKTYRGREVRFDAYQCSKCKKIMMRGSLAQQLNLECGRVGVPEMEFEKIKPPVVVVKKKNTFKPDYFVQNGQKTKYDYDDREWEELPESAILVVSYSRVCNFDDHDSADQLVMVRVDEKRGGKKEYLLLVGYCEDCGKYYIAQEDYEIIYSAGRPNVTIYDDTNSDYYIQSGAVFEEEKQYLKKIETGISGRISEIKNNEDYVSQYATGDYDEIGALQYKKAMSLPLQEEIDEISTHIDKPYGYRVELMNGTQPVVYYLGASDFEIAGEKIISFNSDFGREMVNYRNIEITKGGVKYQVKRRRQFDISKAILYGYMEQSDEDAIFREGLTDPYLIKVLNTRKKQHQLIDIMFTIQENQNAIVDEPLKRNIIVQGCAGSGKTVVMLQRLSALKYGNPDFDFSRVVILTPNDNFNTHISGLASSLQLGYVERLSVERYYEALLLRYSEAFKLKYAIADEVNVNQVYVDYMYSDEFMKQFWNAYDITLDRLQMMYEEVLLYANNILDERTINNCISVSENEILRMLSLINELNLRIERAVNGKENIDRKATYEVFVSDGIEEREKFFELLDRIEGYSIKSVFNEVYDAASTMADDTLYLRTGKRYLGGTRGTHRYDLYLQLLFAQKIYGYNAGNNNLVCIDEGQDLCPCEYRLIKDINGAKPIFNVYGDTNQLIKNNRGISDWKAVEEYIEAPKMFNLNENFRNTNQITQFCNDNFKMNVSQTGVDGRKVSEIIRNKFEETLSALEVNEDRIAVLVPRAVRKKEYIDIEQLPRHIRDIIGDQIGNGRICVSYVDEVKGIEFEKVFVIPNGLSNNEKYIAYTRALSELIIVFDEELEEKIKEKEQERLKAQEKAIKKANEPEDKDKKETLLTGQNVNFGKVKSNKSKAVEFEDSKIAYTFKCRRCKKIIEMSPKDVDRFEAAGLELPKTCPDCKKELDEEVEVGKCRFCGTMIRMKRSKFEHLKKEGKLVLCCHDCVPKLQEEKQRHDNMVYQERKCSDCYRSFEITYGEKSFYDKKGWLLPSRCPECRKRRRG